MIAKLGRFALRPKCYVNIARLLNIFCSKRTSLFLSGASRQIADSPNRHPLFFSFAAAGRKLVTPLSKKNFIGVQLFHLIGRRRRLPRWKLKKNVHRAE